MPDEVNCSLDSKSIPWLVWALAEHEPSPCDDLPSVGSGETPVGEMNDTMRRIESCLQDMILRSRRPEVTRVEMAALDRRAILLEALKWDEASEICGAAATLNGEGNSAIALRKGGIIVRMDGAAIKRAELAQRLAEQFGILRA